MAEDRNPKPGTKSGKNTPGTTGNPNQGTNQPRQSERTGRRTEEDSNTSGRRNPSERMDEDTE